MTALSFRTATLDDVAAVTDMVNGGYRGDRSRRGWTTEADLLEGLRTNEDEITGLISGEDTVMLVAESGDQLVGTVLLRDTGGSAYLGMLVIDPDRQASGLGKQLMAAAEDFVRERWGATSMWMTVLVRRSELIAFYERRGYRRTGRQEAFPSDTLSTPTVEDLIFEVLEKDL